MTSKRHRKPNTKKNKELKPVLPPKQTLKQNQRFFHKYFSTQNVYRLLAAISVLLNFWFAYLALRPIVTIDYASHLIPKNPIGLPLKIYNHSYLSIHNVKIIIEPHIKGDVSLIGPKCTQPICDKLGSNKSIDYIFNIINIDLHNPNISGYIIVTLEYKLSYLPNIITDSQKFALFKSQDGYIRWIVIQ